MIVVGESADEGGRHDTTRHDTSMKAGRDKNDWARSSNRRVTGHRPVLPIHFWIPTDLSVCLRPQTRFPVSRVSEARRGREPQKGASRAEALSDGERKRLAEAEPHAEKSSSSNSSICICPQIPPPPTMEPCSSHGAVVLPAVGRSIRPDRIRKLLIGCPSPQFLTQCSHWAVRSSHSAPPQVSDAH